MPTPKHKSMKQVRYLLSKGSPLSKAQQQQLEAELHAGRVKVAAPKKGGKPK